MGSDLETLDIRNRRGWRAWLAKHHASSPGVWLVFHKDHTGVKRIAYALAQGRSAAGHPWLAAGKKLGLR